MTNHRSCLINALAATAAVAQVLVVALPGGAESLMMRLAQSPAT